jgi:hypothetical protein
MSHKHDSMMDGTDDVNRFGIGKLLRKDLFLIEPHVHKIWF